MNRATDAVDYGLLTVGTVYSLENIEHVLGIVILVIQLAWIITKLGVAIYKKIKKGENLSELDVNIGEVTGLIGGIADKVGDIKENVDKAEKEDNNNEPDTSQK